MRALRVAGLRCLLGTSTLMCGPHWFNAICNAGSCDCKRTLEKPHKMIHFFMQYSYFIIGCIVNWCGYLYIIFVCCIKTNIVKSIRIYMYFPSWGSNHFGFIPLPHPFRTRKAIFYHLPQCLAWCKPVFRAKRGSNYSSTSPDAWSYRVLTNVLIHP
jgi:hypothetical protein